MPGCERDAFYQVGFILTHPFGSTTARALLNAWRCREHGPMTQIDDVVDPEDWDEVRYHFERLGERPPWIEETRLVLVNP